MKNIPHNQPRFFGKYKLSPSPRRAACLKRQPKLPPVPQFNYPLGKVNQGLIKINSKGEIVLWDCFRDFQENRIPGGFFAVRAQSEKDKPVSRALQSTPTGSLTGMERMTHYGRYPFCWFDFMDRKLPVKVNMEVYDPMVTLEIPDCGISCCVVNLTAMNPNSWPVKVSFFASKWQKMAQMLSGPTKNNKSETGIKEHGQLLKSTNSTILHNLTTKNDQTIGELALAIISHKEAQGDAGWITHHPIEFKHFIDENSYHTQSDTEIINNDYLYRGLETGFQLQAGREWTVSFVLAWKFEDNSNFWHQASYGYEETGIGNTLDFMRELEMKFDEIEDQTRLYYENLS